MRKRFLIAKSNMEKAKLTVGALAFLIMLSTVLLYCCFAVLLDVDSFVDRKNDSLNGTKFQIMAGENTRERMVPLLSQVNGYEDQETIKGVLYQNASMKNITQDGDKSNMALLFANVDEKTKYNQVHILDKADKKEENAVILPYVMKSANGFKVGDTLRLTTGGHSTDLKVYGFFEDVCFSTPSNMMTYKMYVYGNTFNKLYSECNKGEQVFMSYTKVKDNTDLSKFELEYGDKVAKEFEEGPPWYYGLSYDSMKQGTLAFVQIIVSILMGLGAILLVIIIVVIRFSIVTQLESYLTSIGMLKAAGFTSKQLIGSFLCEFGIITLIGWLLGIIVSILASPFVGNLVSSSMGLYWISKMNMAGIVVSFVAIIAMVMLTTFLTARKIKKITPLVALRKGVENFEFRKNHFDLEKTNAGPVSSLGIKSAFNSGKQNRVIFILLLVFSFACIFCWVWYYNFVYKGDAITKLIGMETNEIIINGTQDYKQDKIEYKKLPEVQNVIGCSQMTIELIKGNSNIDIVSSVYEDYSKLKNMNLIKGRCPKHDNEVLITNNVADKLNVDVGDTIQAKYRGKTYEFLVVGMNQQIQMLGKWAGLTEGGIRRIIPQFHYENAYIYLKPGSNIKNVCNKLERQYRDKDIQVTNSQATFDELVLSFGTAMRGVIIACVILTIVIISTIMYLILKVKIIRERQQLGIWKALGFTTGQLVGQIVISVLPALFIGSSLGIALGYFGINPLMSLLLSMVGIHKVELCIGLVSSVLVCAALLLLGCIVSTLVSLRIRKILPSKLLQEE